MGPKVPCPKYFPSSLFLLFLTCYIPSNLSQPNIMGDPFTAVGLATGIIGLLPICANGFALIEGICKAHGGVATQIIRIRGQKSVSYDLKWSGSDWEMLIETSCRYSEVNDTDGPYPPRQRGADH